MFKSTYLTYLFLLFTIPFSNAQTFEGVIQLSTDGPDSLMRQFTVKAHKTFYEEIDSVSHIRVITDHESGNRWTLMSKTNQHVAVKQNMQKNLGFKRKETFFEKEMELLDLQLETTKETKIIEGLECVKIKGKSEYSEGEAWIAKNLMISVLDIFPCPHFLNTKSQSLQRAFAKEGFILSMWIRDRETNRLQNLKTSLIKQTVSNQIFTPPADSEVLDMTNMRALMQATKDDPEKVKLIREMMRKVGRF